MTGPSEIEQAEKPEPQVRNPERNKRTLIEATLNCLAKHGLNGTTVSTIVQEAGLSRGMIHLHFGGKDKLVEAAAEVFAGQYYDSLERQLEGTKTYPAGFISALVRADLGEELLNERSVAIWRALRGAARENDKILEHSTPRDDRLRAMLSDAFLAISDHDQSDQFISDATLGTLALLEGMWTDFMVQPDNFVREDAVRIVLRFLGGQFPGKL